MSKLECLKERLNGTEEEGIVLIIAIIFTIIIHSLLIKGIVYEKC